MNAIIEMIADTTALMQDMCPVRWAQEGIATAYRVCDGLDVMSRDGMAQLDILLRELTSGKGQSNDIPMIEDLCTVIATTEGSELARRAAANVLYSLAQYPEEWDLHCRRHRCTALQCESYYSLYIDPALCQGCHDCLKAAPVGSIASGEGMISVVMDDGPCKALDITQLCPNGAWKKAGAVKPRLPEEPVAVGSFGAGSEGGARRRRRRGGDS